MVKPALLEPIVVARQTLNKADALAVMAGSHPVRLSAAARIVTYGGGFQS
jgi:hypothetical protein